MLSHAVCVFQQHFILLNNSHVRDWWLACPVNTFPLNKCQVDSRSRDGWSPVGSNSRLSADIMCLLWRVTAFKCVLTANDTQTRPHTQRLGECMPLKNNYNKKKIYFFFFQNLLPTCTIGGTVLRLVSFIINKYNTRLLSLWKVIEDESTWLLLTFLQGLHVDNPCEHQGMCSQAHYAMYNTCNQQCTCSIFLTSRHYTRCQLLRGWQPFLAACACWESTGRRAKDAFCPHQNGNTGAQYKGKAALCLCVTSKQVCWSGSPVVCVCVCVWNKNVL